VILLFVLYLDSFQKQGTPALPQSSIAADLLKGTITKLATEDLSMPDKARGEQLAKGHVIYEGKSGHILSFDGKCFDCWYIKYTVKLCISSLSAQTWAWIFMSKSYQEPQRKHPQPQNRPWYETHLRHDGGIHGQAAPRQGRSSIWGYRLCVTECTVCVLVCLFCISSMILLICFSGLISRALPREGIHGDSKERSLITGSIMQGNKL